MRCGSLLHRGGAWGLLAAHQKATHRPPCPWAPPVVTLSGSFAFFGCAHGDHFCAGGLRKRETESHKPKKRSVFCRVSFFLACRAAPGERKKSSRSFRHPPLFFGTEAEGAKKKGETRPVLFACWLFRSHWLILLRDRSGCGACCGATLGPRNRCRFSHKPRPCPCSFFPLVLFLSFFSGWASTGVFVRTGGAARVDAKETVHGNHVTGGFFWNRHSAPLSRAPKGSANGSPRQKEDEKGREKRQYPLFCISFLLPMGSWPSAGLCVCAHVVCFFSYLFSITQIHTKKKRPAFLVPSGWEVAC